MLFRSKNINMSAIGEMEIPNIPLKKQHIIGNLFKAQTQKIIILNKIQEKEDKLQKAILVKIENMED